MHYPINVLTSYFISFLLALTIMNCNVFFFHRWIIVLIYLFQNFVRLFLHTTRAGQRGFPFDL